MMKLLLLKLRLLDIHFSIIHVLSLRMVVEWNPFQEAIKAKSQKAQCDTKYFESAIITDYASLLNLVVIYRPYPSPTSSDFLKEFDSFIDDISILPGKLLLVGDFNIHWNEQHKPDVKQFSSITSSVNLNQHVDAPTHRSGNILDHVFSIHDDQLVTNCTVDEKFLSDHQYVLFNVNLLKPPPERVTYVFRNYKDINKAAFENSLSQNLNPIPRFVSPSDIFDWYNSAVRETLDQFAPAEIRTRSTRIRMPWYNDIVHKSRQERRRKERKWRKSRSEADRLEFINANKTVKSNIISAKKAYFTDKLDNADTKQVFQVMNKLLHNNSMPLPSHNDPLELGNKFANFFTNKICKLRQELSCDNDSIATEMNAVSPNCTPLIHFCEVSEDVRSVIVKSSNSAWLLVPEPTWLLKQHNY